MSAADLASQPSLLIYGTPVVSTPLVSIAIPTYKRPDLLHEAIESALSQRECSPYEVIVIDNDQSSEILKVVGCFPSERITVYQNLSNIGMWGNMNRVLELARGEWILILCDDDLLKPNAIRAFERILLTHENEDIACIAGGVELLLSDEIMPIFNTRQPRIQFPLTKRLYSKEKLVCVESNMRLTDVPKLCSSFFRREYIKRLGGWDAKCHGFADLALFLKIQRDKKLFTCMEVFGCFWVHVANESHPSRLWITYPIRSAHRLLLHYVDETTPIGKGIRDMVERSYTSALWKGPYTTEEHRAYAEELLQSIMQKPSRRFLFRNIWLLNMLRRLYTTLRPVLGWLSQTILRSRHKQAVNSRTRGSSKPVAGNIPSNDIDIWNHRNRIP